jgi:hypothetical protein
MSEGTACLKFYSSAKYKSVLTAKNILTVNKKENSLIIN